MNLTIHKQKDHYQIKDEENQVYGTYDTEKEAKDRLADWLEYYKSPLVF